MGTVEATRCVRCELPFASERPAGVLALRCGELVVWRGDPTVAGVIERGVCRACGEETQVASEAACAWLCERRRALRTHREHNPAG